MTIPIAGVEIRVQHGDWLVTDECHVMSDPALRPTLAAVASRNVVKAVRRLPGLQDISLHAQPTAWRKLACGFFIVGGIVDINLAPPLGPWLRGRLIKTNPYWGLERFAKNSREAHIFGEAITGPADEAQSPRMATEVRRLRTHQPRWISPTDTMRSRVRIHAASPGISP